MQKSPWPCATYTTQYLPPPPHLDSSIISYEFVHMKMKVEFPDRASHSYFGWIATFSIFSCQKCFLLMTKHSQGHRNSTLQYKIQQSVFRAKNWRVPPYIIKLAMCSWPDQWFATFETSMGAYSIWACLISKLRKYWPLRDRVLTPQQQQQCLLLFFLKLPVDQAASTIPQLHERCWYTLDTGLLLKTKDQLETLQLSWIPSCIWKRKGRLEILLLS